jgi:aspartokinase-like uncharacterized kinase
MVNLLTVIKVGGSLLADGHLPGILDAIAARSHKRLVVVPGGGPFADAVRSAQAAAGFDDGLAHRLALVAMDQMAQVFAAIHDRFRVVTGLDALRAPGAAGQVPIWSPMDLLAGHPDIPESWSVTSDSLALWLAATFKADQALLIKSTDPKPGWRLADLAGCGIVDEGSPAFAERFAGTVDILGPSRWRELAGAEGLAA